MFRVQAVVAQLPNSAQLSMQVLERADLLSEPEDVQIQKGNHLATVIGVLIPTILTLLT